MVARVTLFACLVALVPLATASGRPLRVYHEIAGSEREYTVAPGDSIWGITGRFTMGAAYLTSLNPLPDPNRLKPGMRLRVSDVHVVPIRSRDGIVIDLAQRSLYWFAKGRVHARFPVGIGRLEWATPPGRYRIVGRREDPIWHVPPAIQAEMRSLGQPVVTTVAPGPDNPLGKYWVQLSASGYGLHGTNAPASVGKYATHGCMRLLPADIERLYREVPDGTPVEVVYEPVKLAQTTDGRVLLEIHRDVYRGERLDAARIAADVAAAGLGDVVDLARVAVVVERAWGTPEEVTLGATAPAVEKAPEPALPGTAAGPAVVPDTPADARIVPETPRDGAPPQAPTTAALPATGP